jgi:acyl-coenzyme A thioesterase PaaI-like protein
MPESWHTRFYRWFFNLFPAYRGTGAWITYIAADWREMRVKLPLSWQTRNYVGTIFGGSMYAAVDPMYMIMLIKILGPDFTVWDKGASIQFKKPGRSTLYAQFLLAPSELEAIRTGLQEENHLNRVYHIDLKDNQGKVHATVEKTVYVAHRRPPDAKVESGQ